MNHINPIDECRLREAIEIHGASESELACFDRLRAGTANDVDITRLKPLAKLADIELRRSVDSVLDELRRNI